MANHCIRGKQSLFWESKSSFTFEARPLYINRLFIIKLKTGHYKHTSKLSRYTTTWSNVCFTTLNSLAYIDTNSSVKAYITTSTVPFLCTFGSIASLWGFSGSTIDGYGSRIRLARGLLAAALAIAISKSTTWIWITILITTFYTDNGR